MVAKRYQDLVVWQLSRKLEDRVFAFTATTPALRDHDYCRQIRRSASSAPRNIVEGFGRFWPAEFARLLRIARGELQETQDHLDKGLEEGYLSASEHSEMMRLANRAIGAATRLLQYLDSVAETWKKNRRGKARRTENPEPEPEPEP
jgi:four helix bundle protein